MCLSIYFYIFTLLICIKCDLPIKYEKGSFMPIFEYKEEYHVHYASFNIPFHAQKSVITVHISQSSINCSNALITCALNPLTVPWLNIENGVFEHLWIPNVFYKHTFSTNVKLKEMKIEILQPKAGKWYIGCTRQKQEHVPKYIDLMRKLQGVSECYYFMSFLSTSYYEDNVAIITDFKQPYHFKISPFKNYSIYRFQAPVGSVNVLVSLSSCNFSGSALEGCPLPLTVSAGTLPVKFSINSTQFTRVHFVHVAPHQEWNYIRIERPIGSLKDITGNIHISIELACKFIVESKGTLSDTNSLDNYKGRNSSSVVTPKCWLYSEMYRYKQLVPSWRHSWQRWTMHHNAMPYHKSFPLDSELRAVPFHLDVEDMSNALNLNLDISAASSRNQVMSGVMVRACISRWLVEQLDTSNWKRNCEGGWVETESLRASLLVPHPPHGLWYLLLQRVCNSSRSCARINVVWSLRLESCASDCSEQGLCELGGLPPVRIHVCRCFRGFMGPDCSKRLQVNSDLNSGYGTVRTTLLTTSNLAFLPAVVLALKRRFFVNAIIYAYTMLFSTLYHLCDERHHCVLSFNALATADFFGALMSIFVTAVAIAHLPRWARSLSRTVASLSLVVALQVNRTSSLSVGMVVALGCLLVAVSWVVHCRRNRACFPNLFYLLSGLLPGGILALIGGAVFILLETNRNYGYTHSAWHTLIALSVAFLLPLRHRIDEHREIGRPTAEDFNPIDLAKDEVIAPEAGVSSAVVVQPTNDTSVSFLVDVEGDRDFALYKL